MNLLHQIQKARAGEVYGARTTSKSMNMAMGGIHPGMYIVVASEQKVGKSTFVNEFFVNGLIEANPDLDIEFNIVSTEMPRQDIEAKMITRKLYLDHRIILSSNYIMGKKLNPDGSRVRVSDDHYKLIEKVYKEHVVPISGTYDDDGRLIHKGKINWLSRDNPTGLRNHFIQHAKDNGELITETYNVVEDHVPKVMQRTVGYKPHNPSKLVINIVDHMRQLPRERGFSMKENVDKMSEYLVESSRLFKHVNIGVVHLNRWVTVDMLRYYGDRIKPTSDNIKDTGNLSEDCSVMITMLDPSDAMYKLETHMGYNFKEFNNAGKAKYRSAHIVENRYGDLTDMRLGFVGGAHFFEI